MTNPRHWHGAAQHHHDWTGSDDHEHGAELATPATPVEGDDPMGYGPPVQERDKTYGRKSARTGRS
jgi:hypothetical protein